MTATDRKWQGVSLAVAKELDAQICDLFDHYREVGDELQTDPVPRELVQQAMERAGLKTLFEAVADAEAAQGRHDRQQATEGFSFRLLNARRFTAARTIVAIIKAFREIKS